MGFDDMLREAVYGKQFFISSESGVFMTNFVRLIVHDSYVHDSFGVGLRSLSSHCFSTRLQNMDSSNGLQPPCTGTICALLRSLVLAPQPRCTPLGYPSAPLPTDVLFQLPYPVRTQDRVPSLQARSRWPLPASNPPSCTALTAPAPCPAC